MIVIPWTDFQPAMDPISYNHDVLQKLAYLLEAAARRGLYVAGRVGYTHNRNVANSPFAAWQNSHSERCTLLMRNNRMVKEAWTEMLGRINAIVSRYPATYLYSFLSWEDFTCVDWLWPRHSLEERVKMAAESGFQRYLAAAFPSVAAANLEIQGVTNLTTFDQVPVPSPEQQTLRMHWSRYFNK